MADRSIPIEDWRIIQTVKHNTGRMKLVLNDGTEVFLEPDNKLSWEIGLAIQQYYYRKSNKK